MFTKEELKEIFDKLQHLFEIEEVYKKYKVNGCNILASIITTTDLFKHSYYNIQLGNKDESFDFSVYPNIEEPSKNIYTEEEIMNELRKLPEIMIFYLFEHTMQKNKELPSKWMELILKIMNSKEELKEFVERNPRLIMDCGWHGCERFTQAFINIGVDMSLNEFGRTNVDSALHFSAFNGHPGVMRMLLDIGRPITDIIASVGVKSGNVEVVKLAIAAGADYSQGYASEGIIDAVDKGNEEMVKMLLEAGSDPTIEGYKAFHLAYNRQGKGKNKQVYQRIYQMLEYYHIKQTLRKMDSAILSEESTSKLGK